MKRKTVGYGYVGEWVDGTLGWFLPKHMSTGKTPERPHATFDSAIGNKGVLCRVTIEEIPGARKRTITK